MDGKVGPALLHDVNYDPLTPATRQRLVLVVGEGDEVREASHGRCAGEGQTEEAADGVDDGAADEEVQVVAHRLLQAAGGPIDEQRCEVLVQVVQQGHAQARHDGGKHRPDGQVLVDAEGIDEPRPLGAGLGVRPGRLEFLRHVQPSDGHLAEGLGDAREGEDRDGHAKVREELAQRRVEQVRELHVPQFHGQEQGAEAEQRREEGGLTGPGAVGIAKRDEGLGDEDDANERREDLLHEASHV
mmetsp:Transcript_43349/g.137874  ORF Transcript_43349/g.137874 Transcript_43349/m.137874 type:complete len:243 (+) Transcript_43349:1111-1839(+)